MANREERQTILNVLLYFKREAEDVPIIAPERIVFSKWDSADEEGKDRYYECTLLKEDPEEPGNSVILITDDNGNSIEQIEYYYEKLGHIFGEIIGCTLCTVNEFGKKPPGLSFILKDKMKYANPRSYEKRRDLSAFFGVCLNNDFFTNIKPELVKTKEYYNETNKNLEIDFQNREVYRTQIEEVPYFNGVIKSTNEAVYCIKCIISSTESKKKCDMKSMEKICSDPRFGKINGAAMKKYENESTFFVVVSKPN